MEENVDAVIKPEKHGNFESFDIGGGNALYQKSKSAQHPLWMINHCLTPNVKITMFEMEFKNEHEGNMYVVSVELLQSMHGSTELVFGYRCELAKKQEIEDAAVTLCDMEVGLGLGLR